MDTLRRLFRGWAAQRAWLIANQHKAPCDRHGVPLQDWTNKGATLDQALAFVDGERVIGVGINLALARDLVCLDVDGGYDPEDGSFKSHIPAVLLHDRFTYCEVSRSGRGLHLFWRAPEGVSKLQFKAGGHELYCATGRFIVTTGNTLGGCDVEPAPISAELLAQAIGWIRELAPAPKAEPTPAPTATATVDDQALLDRILQSRQAAKARALLAGDTTGYPSESEADEALCSLLAWWTRDPAQIERLWLASKLGEREKVRRRADYRERTIAKALGLVPARPEPQQQEVSLRQRLRAARRLAWTAR